MEKQTILTSTELEQIFAQIRKTGNDKLGDKIYITYLPYIKQYAKTFKLSNEKVEDIYSEVIAYIYDKIVAGVAEAKDFNMYFRAIMEKKCVEALKQEHSEETQFQSSMLRTSYEKGVQSQANSFEAIRRKVARQERMTHSLLYTIQVLNEMKNNEELAKAHDLSGDRIAIFEDYHGINAEGVAYSVEEICNKYNISEKRARTIVASVSMKLRHLDSLKTVRQELK